jgi:ABC-type glycerol-3-phosphate transport system substrate-binding protein
MYKTHTLKRLTFSLLVAIILISMISLSACTPTPEPTEAPTPEETEEAAPEETEEPAPEETEEAAPEETEEAAPEETEETAINPLDAETYEEWIAAKEVNEEEFTFHILCPFNPEAPNFINFFDYVYGEFYKIYPNATIEYEQAGWGELNEKMAAYAMSGTPLDVAHTEDLATAYLESLGVAESFNGQMPAFQLIHMGNGILEEPSNHIVDGEIYTWPEATFPYMFGVRKDLLDEVGVDISAIQSLEDLVAAVDAVATGTDMDKPFGLMLGDPYAVTDNTMWFFLANGLDHQADFSNKEAWIDAVEWIGKLFPYVPEAALEWRYAESEQAFALGEIAFLRHGMWLNGAADNYSTEFFLDDKSGVNVMPLPYGPYADAESPFWYSGANAWAVMSYSEHKQAAFDFITIATSAQGVLSRGTIPSVTNWEYADLVEKYPEKAKWEWWQEEWNELITNRQEAGGAMPAREELEQRWYELMIDYWYGNTTPEQMYDEFEAFAVPLIEELEE